jgi:hypothetical protein
MRFHRDQAAFGRHQTFAVRYGWLSKGFQALKRNPNILRSDEAIAELGVGKNMVESIGYWMRAFQLVEPDSSKPTEIGSKLFSARGYDPYLEDEATIWLLHWLLVTNPSQATSWYWFFNRFHKNEFSAEELVTALTDFVRDQIKDIKQPAASTLKSDATLIPRMYTQSKLHKHMPIEEALDSPLALLGLIRHTPRERIFVSAPANRHGLPASVIGFAVSQLFSARSSDVLPVDELMYGQSEFPAIGAVFRLTEQGLLAKLEELVRLLPGFYQLNETAGVHQLYQLQPVDPMMYLERHYALSTEGEAA